MSTDKAMVTDAVTPVGPREYDAAAKIIDPQAFERWETGDGFDRLQVIGRMKAERLKAQAISAALSEAEQQPVAGPSLGWKPANSSPRRFLLLASYCGEDNDQCTDKSPCPECLAMCNIYDEDSQYRGTLSHPPAKREAGEAAAPVQDVLEQEECAVLIDQMLADPAYRNHPQRRMALTIAARTVRRGRHLTAEEKLNNILDWISDEQE